MGKLNSAGPRPAKYKNNPLVPVDSQRVLAAIEKAGKRVAGLASELGISQQTLDAIVKRGTRGRCRQKTLRGLAGALHVSEAWLAGDEGAPVRGLAPWEGHPGCQDPDSPVIVDENAFWLRPELSGKAAAEGAARYQLAWWEIGEMVIGAWRRDLEKGHRVAREALNALPAVGDEKDSGEDFEAVILGVQRVLSSTWWQLVLMTFAPEAPEPPARSRRFFTEAQEKRLRAQNEKIWKRRREETDELAVAGAEFLRRILQPWIDGEADLDYRLIVETLRWVASESLFEAFKAPVPNALRSE